MPARTPGVFAQGLYPGSLPANFPASPRVPGCTVAVHASGDFRVSLSVQPRPWTSPSWPSPPNPPLPKPRGCAAPCTLLPPRSALLESRCAPGSLRVPARALVCPRHPGEPRPGAPLGFSPRTPPPRPPHGVRPLGAPGPKAAGRSRPRLNPTARRGAGRREGAAAGSAGASPRQTGGRAGGGGRGFEPAPEPPAAPSSPTPQPGPRSRGRRRRNAISRAGAWAPGDLSGRVLERRGGPSGGSPQRGWDVGGFTGSSTTLQAPQAKTPVRALGCETPAWGTGAAATSHLLEHLLPLGIRLPANCAWEKQQKMAQVLGSM
nr:translation initiation factor IF-2 [Oryctolagus cuniculus]